MTRHAQFRPANVWFFSDAMRILLTSLLYLVVVQVNFVTKLVALKPGKNVREMIKNVMLGKDEGADDYGTGDSSSRGIAGRVRFITKLHILVRRLWQRSRLCKRSCYKLIH